MSAFPATILGNIPTMQLPPTKLPTTNGELPVLSPSGKPAELAPTLGLTVPPNWQERLAEVATVKPSDPPPPVIPWSAAFFAEQLTFVQTTDGADRLVRLAKRP